MSKTIKIHHLHCGQVQVDIALPFRQTTGIIPKIHPALAAIGLLRSKKHQVVLPVSSFLVEHPKGLVLLDTGWHTDMRIDQIKHLGRFHYKINKGSLPEGKAITEQLAQLGITPKDLDYVVVSHLHSDHVSGVKLLTDAKNIITSEEEWANRKSRVNVPSMYKGIDFKPFKFSPSNYGPQKRAFDLFDDESVLFVHYGGHTPGLFGTLVQNNGKFFIYAGDCGYAKKSWEQMIMPGICKNEDQLRKALEWERIMSRQPNCIDIIACHDTEAKPQVIEF
ncbi:MAG: N-acyl homoserine lactonase family protein [Proteobacteria bacterium]|nr:N-acyl homoserine lactonase family protein [Pseudomonadota bacterium]